jgi:hypothetical protein
MPSKNAVGHRYLSSNLFNFVPDVSDCCLVAPVTLMVVVGGSNPLADPVFLIPLLRDDRRFSRSSKSINFHLPLCPSVTTAAGSCSSASPCRIALRSGFDLRTAKVLSISDCLIFRLMGGLGAPSAKILAAHSRTSLVRELDCSSDSNSCSECLEEGGIFKYLIWDFTKCSLYGNLLDDSLRTKEDAYENHIVS